MQRGSFQRLLHQHQFLSGRTRQVPAQTPREPGLHIQKAVRSKKPNQLMTFPFNISKIARLVRLRFGERCMVDLLFRAGAANYEFSATFNAKAAANLVKAVLSFAPLVKWSVISFSSNDHMSPSPIMSSALPESDS